MKKKKTLIISIIVIAVVLVGLFLASGGSRTDVFLKGFDLSQDGKTMTLKVGVSSSAGYIRKMKQTSGSLNYYFTFYSTFGINSKLGAKDTFEIELDNNLDEIYFYTGGKGYKKVLEKNDNGEWIKVSNSKESNYKPTELENVNIDISDISLTGATIIIKDTNKNPYTYGAWYKIEKQVDGKWYEVETLLDNYGFNSIGYLPDENNEVKFIMDWEWLYGELPLGSYRILKEVGSKYISIEFGIATTSNKKIEVIKSEYHNDIKFNKYLERDNKVIYVAGNLEEIYYTELDTRMTLKDYITKSYQTLDDGIKHLTDNMNLINTLKDGGTTIYKSSEYDITVVKCNTIAGNKNIFIGDYSMKFDSDSMCK